MVYGDCGTAFWLDSRSMHGRSSILFEVFISCKLKYCYRCNVGTVITFATRHTTWSMFTQLSVFNFMFICSILCSHIDKDAFCCTLYRVTRVPRYSIICYVTYIRFSLFDSRFFYIWTAVCNVYKLLGKCSEITEITQSHCKISVSNNIVSQYTC